MCDAPGRNRTSARVLGKEEFPLNRAYWAPCAPVCAPVPGEVTRNPRLPGRHAVGSCGDREVILVRTYAPQVHLRWPHINAWLVAVGAAFVLAAAVAAGALIGQSSESAAPTPGLASKEVVAVIDCMLVAFNRGDIDAFAAYYAKDAVADDDGTLLEGREEIAKVNRFYYNLGARYERTSVVIQDGNLVAYSNTCPACPGGETYNGMDMIEFDDNLKVVHHWMAAG